MGRYRKYLRILVVFPILAQYGCLEKSLDGIVVGLGAYWCQQLAIRGDLIERGDLEPGTYDLVVVDLLGKVPPRTLGCIEYGDVTAGGNLAVSEEDKCMLGMSGWGQVCKTGEICWASEVEGEFVVSYSCPHGATPMRWTAAGQILHSPRLLDNYVVWLDEGGLKVADVLTGTIDTIGCNADGYSRIVIVCPAIYLFRVGHGTVRIIQEHAWIETSWTYGPKWGIWDICACGETPVILVGRTDRGLGPNETWKGEGRLVEPEEEDYGGCVMRRDIHVSPWQVRMCGTQRSLWWQAGGSIQRIDLEDNSVSETGIQGRLCRDCGDQHLVLEVRDTLLVLESETLSVAARIEGAIMPAIAGRWLAYLKNRSK